MKAASEGASGAAFGNYVNRNMGENTMSVSLLVFKGEHFNSSTSKVINEIPVSFQSVWNNIWEKAISECSVKKFVTCGMFTVDDIPNVITELDTIYNWVHHNGGEETKYIQDRILKLKNFFNNIYLDDNNSDYWFDLG